MAPAIQPPPPDILRPLGAGPLVLTCEHASAALPPPLRATAQDRAVLRRHWGVDIGAAAVTRALSEALDAPAVLGVASRLVVDLNRAPDDPTLALAEVEGLRLGFNADLDGPARAQRIEALHRPYHSAVSRILAERRARGGPVLLFSVHSFTPDYLGSIREVELGVLFDEHEDLARRLRADLGADGWDARLNQPWSGLEGLIYAAHRHGQAQGVPYLELEIRQDLIADDADAEAVAARLVPPLLRLMAHIGTTEAG
jgi:predicted N-formylglutamate amidohydrolase